MPVPQPKSFPYLDSQISVPLLDLKAQYASLKGELDAAMLRVAESQRFILGPEVERFERAMCEYLEVEFALGVSSGTDALLLALMALGVGPGDSVIVPTFSFFATAGVVSRLGARPVFVDVDPSTFNLDPDSFAAHIDASTKAVVPVHLFGQSADMDPIMSIAAEHGIAVVEDAAQAIGVRYRDGRRVGAIGKIGCFSFFPSKNLGAFGDGGLVTTNDPELFERMRIMRVHGGEPKYYHSVVGGNFRLDELQAAVLSVKLPHLDEWGRARRKNAARYGELFRENGAGGDDANGVVLPSSVYESTGVPDVHIYNQYTIRVRERDALREWMTENRIGTEVYYPVPLHLQECFAGAGALVAGSLPVSEELAREVLALPIYPELSDSQLMHVVCSVSEFMVQI
ncbi:MAG: DegT/DnrJ/EryC1/StrS family aminotransferase [bacterium]|nr:DegT/DnrJ/EryC1/StrS family aminotransferase [Candidatus Kapabacteria bacterium]